MCDTNVSYRRWIHLYCYYCWYSNYICCTCTERRQGNKVKGRFCSPEIYILSYSIDFWAPPEDVILFLARVVELTISISSSYNYNQLILHSAHELKVITIINQPKSNILLQRNLCKRSVTQQLLGINQYELAPTIANFSPLFPQTSFCQTDIKAITLSTPCRTQLVTSWLAN